MRFFLWGFFFRCLFLLRADDRANAAPPLPEHPVTKPGDLLQPQALRYMQAQVEPTFELHAPADLAEEENVIALDFDRRSACDGRRHFQSQAVVGDVAHDSRHCPVGLNVQHSYRDCGIRRQPVFPASFDRPIDLVRPRLIEIVALLHSSRYKSASAGYSYTRIVARTGDLGTRPREILTLKGA